MAVLYDVLSPLLLIYLSSSLTGAEQYCKWETFTAQCQPNQMIIMKTAKYGRMERNRCIEREFGYLGCVRDVLLSSDVKCSGRQNCSIKVPDETFDLEHPCPKDLQKYFEAAYYCVEVVPGSRDTCTQEDAIIAPPGSGYISSYISDQTGCGGTEAPWVIRAEVGQVIEVTLFDFTLFNNSAISAAGSPHCHVYVIIKEPGPNRRDTICGGRKRISHVYTTQTNELEIRLVTGSPGRNKQFLVKYNTVGCVKLSAPPNGWMETRGQHVTMGCDYDDLTWTLTCNDTTWFGDMYNCSSDIIIDDTDTYLAIPHTLSIVIIVGVAIFIGICILLMGLVCLKRQRRRDQTEVFHDFAKTSVITCKASYCDGKTSYQLEPLTNTSRVCPTHPRGYSDHNDYAYMDDVTKMGGIQTQIGCPGRGLEGGSNTGPVFMPTCTIRCSRTCGPDASQLYSAATSGSSPVCSGHSQPLPDLYATPSRESSTVCPHCAECAKVRYVGIDSSTAASSLGTFEKIPLTDPLGDPPQTGEQINLSPITQRRTKSEEDVYAQTFKRTDAGCDSGTKIQPYREKTCSPILVRKI